MAVRRFPDAGRLAVARLGELTDPASMAGSALAKVAALIAKGTPAREGISPGYFPIPGTDSGDGNPLRIVSVPEGATATAWGAWTQLAATVGAFPVAITHLRVMSGTFGGDNRVSQVELGVGASGAEVAQTRLIIGNDPTDNPFHLVPLPLALRVAAGARLAVRMWSGGANVAYNLKVAVNYVRVT